MHGLTDDALQIARLVHINVPWNLLPRYMDLVLQQQMNIEIGFMAEELDRVPLAAFEATAARLHQRGCGISLHAPFWDLCPGSVDPLIRQIAYLRLQQFFDAAEVFDPIQVVCHTGFDPRHHHGQRQSWLEKSLAFWEPLVARAERSKVPLLLENVWEFDPGFHRDLLQRVDSPWFGFCLDVGHQNSFSTTQLADWLANLADFLKEVHLHDNDGNLDAHLPVGRGNIDFLFLFDFLQSRGLKPVLTLEPHQEEHLYETLTGLRSVLSQLTGQPSEATAGRREGTGTAAAAES